MFWLVIYVNPTCVCGFFFLNFLITLFKKTKSFHHVAFFAVLNSQSVGRKHKLVTAGSESAVFFSPHGKISSVSSV